jgi:thioredoxin-related protein
MKKIFITLLLIVGSVAAQAQELTWNNDMNKAVAISNKEKKPLMLFFTGSDWCGWCMRLQREVFLTPEFTKWAQNNVILVELDYPRKKQLAPEIVTQNDQMQQMFSVQGYPTVWFVKPSNNGDKVNLEKLGSTGYVAGGPEKWLEAANTILKIK